MQTRRLLIQAALETYSCLLYMVGVFYALNYEEMGICYLFFVQNFGENIRSHTIL